jgi:hypothetical protein
MIENRQEDTAVNNVAGRTEIEKNKQRYMTTSIARILSFWTKRTAASEE